MEYITVAESQLENLDENDEEYQDSEPHEPQELYEVEERQDLEGPYDLRDYNIAVLKITCGGLPGIEYLPIYPNQEIRVGRDGTCCYPILNPCISKQHFRIYSIIYEQGNKDFPPLVYCEDLESSNGTYVNSNLIGIIGNERVGYLLSDGDIIEIRPSWRFQFQQPIHRTVIRSSTEVKDLGYFQEMFTVSDRILGEGQYGKVYLAKDNTDLRQLACKIVNIEGVATQGLSQRDSESRTQPGKHWYSARQAPEDRRTAAREIRLLSRLSHPHIINLRKAFSGDTALYIFTDLAPGGDLYSFLDSHSGVLEDCHSRVISLQILRAIEYLHSKNIAHRDIKTENVLVTQTDFGGRVVLTDFGFATYVNERTGRMKSTLGTIGFAAPEVEKAEESNDGYTLAVDMWSFGVLIACLLTGQREIPKDLSQLSQLQINDKFSERSENDTRETWMSLSRLAQRFLRKLLLVDPEERMTATEALGHSWFKKPKSEANLMEERYRRIIRFWKKRTGDEDIIEILPSHSPPQENPGPRLRRKLPDVSASPFFSLDRHLNLRENPRRQKILDSLQDSGLHFVTEQSSRLAVPKLVSGRNLFETGPLEKTEDEVDLVPTHPVPGSDCSMHGYLNSQLQYRQSRKDTEEESRKSKTKRKRNES